MQQSEINVKEEQNLAYCDEGQNYRRAIYSWVCPECGRDCRVVVEIRRDEVECRSCGEMVRRGDKGWVYKFPSNE